MCASALRQQHDDDDASMRPVCGTTADNPIALCVQTFQHHESFNIKTYAARRKQKKKSIKQQTVCDECVFGVQPGTDEGRALLVSCHKKKNKRDTSVKNYLSIWVKCDDGGGTRDSTPHSIYLYVTRATNSSSTRRSNGRG